MRAWHLGWLALPLVALAQDGVRPQLDAAQAASHTVAHYLAQGPHAWTPPPTLQPLRTLKPDWVVAVDGSGTHSSLQAARTRCPAPVRPGQRAAGSSA
jgi:pectin methylesterase-like acyl-CoA thioesterase